jgi:hypothetical protein
MLRRMLDAVPPQLGDWAQMLARGAKLARPR